MSPSPRHPYLLIDNSNSRTKAALAGREALGEKRALPTPHVTPESLRELSAGWEFDRVILSSVVPEKARLIREFVAGNAGCDLLEVSHRIALGITIDFSDPSTVGADRLANAAAVVALYESPAVVIDFGTAVTFDVISAQNAYLGGVIAPGLDVMTDYLHQRTALLPHIEISEPTEVIGKTTESAMLAGAVHGYRGLIKEILAEIEDEIGAPLRVIGTGGYAELIASKLPVIETVNRDLNLEGLRVIGNLNTPSNES